MRPCRRSLAQLKGVAVALPSAGGAAGGAVVDSAALDAFAEKVTGSNGVLAATAPLRAERARRGRSGCRKNPRTRTPPSWPRLKPNLAPTGLSRSLRASTRNKAILFDDRWASAREDLARAYYDNDPAALNGSFIGLGKTIAAEAQWFANESESEELKAVFQKAGCRGPRTGCVQQERLPLRE